MATDKPASSPAQEPPTLWELVEGWRVDADKRDAVGEQDPVLSTQTREMLHVEADILRVCAQLLEDALNASTPPALTSPLHEARYACGASAKGMAAPPKFCPIHGERCELQATGAALPSPQDEDEDNASAILQSVLQMLGIPAYDASYFAADGNWSWCGVRQAIERYRATLPSPQESEIAALHRAIADFDAVTDPEEHPDLHERAARLLGAESGECGNAICRELSQLRAALSSGWQPIETAPKEQEFILVAYGVTVTIGWYSELQGYWCDAANGDDRCEPTHWMRLPARPKIPK